LLDPDEVELFLKEGGEIHIFPPQDRFVVWYEQECHALPEDLELARVSLNETD